MKQLSIALFFLLVYFSPLAKSNEFNNRLIKIDEGIYAGSRLVSLQDAEYLKSIKIKTIINLQGGDLNSRFDDIVPWMSPGEKPENIAAEKEMALSLGLEFFHVPLTSLEPVTKEENLLIDKILSFMHDKNNQPIYIHCEHGDDRTGLIVALYRVKYDGFSVQASRDEWIKNGHNKLHQFFTNSLDKYYFLKVKEFF